MRLLRNLNLNPKAIRDSRLRITADNEVAFNTTHSLLLPAGTTAERSYAPTAGMIRYNEETGQIEVYQSGVWRSLRFKEATQIIQQNLGNGDGISMYYGPLSPTPPATVENGATWGGQNVMVYVENVYQIFNTNYTVEQNPTVDRTVDVFAATGSTTLTINSVADVIVGQTISGSAFPLNTVVTQVDPITSIVTVSQATIQDINVASTVTFSYPAGYYIKFTGASAFGKPVMVLHGFDK